MGTSVSIPIPDRDFDPTEVAVSWRVLTRNGHRVVFATESGAPGVADDIMVTGRGLDLVVRAAGAGRHPDDRADAARKQGRSRSAYRDMLAVRRSFSIRSAGRKPASTASTRCCCPADIAPAECAATSTATSCTGSSWTPLPAGLSWPRSVTACCSPRAALTPRTGRSVLYGRKTTALTWAMERLAWRLTRITRFWDPELLPDLHRASPASPAATCQCSRKSLVHLTIRRISVTSCADRRAGGSSPPAWRATRRPTRGRHSSSTTAATCRRVGRAIPTRSQLCCRRS